MIHAFHRSGLPAAAWKSVGAGHMVFVSLLVLGVSLLASGNATAANNLTIASDNTTGYQIVVPDKAKDKAVDRWLRATAQLMQTAFRKSGFPIPVVRESAKNPNRPGIYLGPTQFAREHHIQVKTNDWTYVWKTVGKNLVIVGTDRTDPGTADSWEPLAQLGSVKGALDFLRKYVGVRFLFLNCNDMRNPNHFRDNGTVPIDTRSIAFEKVKKVALPADLNIRKTPALRSRPAGGGTENFYTIANNYFPRMKATGTQYPRVKWNKVISLKKYGKNHPEYFAVMPNGERASVEALANPGEHPRHMVPLDVTNPDVIHLMASAVEDKIKNGAKTVRITTLDRFNLARCNGPGCNALFGMTAKNWKEVKARGHSGKLWKIFFAIAKRVHKKYPKATILIWDYQDTPLGSPYVKSLKKFPVNVMPLLHMGVMHDFTDKLEGTEFPAGVAAVEETFTGFSLDGPYAPERTPAYAARIAKAMVKYNIEWTRRDGRLGYVRGMQAPAYYVYGRMIDDTSATSEDLLNEFHKAAFGKVSGQMSKFFELLHDHIEIYSSYLGLYDPGWGTQRRNHNENNKWYHQLIYTASYMKQADAQLTSAEKNATDPDVKARLHLIRIEFDYVTGLSKVFTLQDAWNTHPSSRNLKVLLDAVDHWHAQIKAVADKPLSDWPDMQPFGGNGYEQAALQATHYQNENWLNTAIDWDTAAIRTAMKNGKPAFPEAIAATRVSQSPGIDSAAWKQAPTVFLRQRSDMPHIVTRTTAKVLHDANNLYVLMKSRGNLRHNRYYIEHMSAPNSEKDVVKKKEVAEVSIQPKPGGPIYLFAGNPVDGPRYKAVVNSVHGKKRVSGQGDWDYAYKIGSMKDKAHSYYGWTAWFKIPFSEVKSAAPGTGTTWHFAMAHKGKEWLNNDMIWPEDAHLTKDKEMGKLRFK